MFLRIVDLKERFFETNIQLDRMDWKGKLMYEEIVELKECL